MDDQIRKRLKWIRLYEELGNAGVVCLRCNISRPHHVSGARAIKMHAISLSTATIHEVLELKRCLGLTQIILPYLRGLIEQLIF